MTASNYEFSYCTDFSFNVLDGPQCDMEVNGVPCNSCEISIGGGSQYGENCEVFDCTNTHLKFSGDRCGLFSSPTLLVEAEVNYLYSRFWPCPDGCNLCGENGYMTNGRANFTYRPQLLAVDYYFQCYDIMYGAMVGGLGETNYCETLPPLAKEPCGCQNGLTLPPGTTPVQPPVGQVNPPALSPPSLSPPSLSPPSISPIEIPTETPQAPQEEIPVSGSSHRHILPATSTFGLLALGLWLLLG